MRLFALVGALVAAAVAWSRSYDWRMKRQGKTQNIHGWWD